jgi:hypothetical protein
MYDIPWKKALWWRGANVDKPASLKFRGEIGTSVTRMCLSQKIACIFLLCILLNRLKGTTNIEDTLASKFGDLASGQRSSPHKTQASHPCCTPSLCFASTSLSCHSSDSFSCSSYSFPCSVSVTVGLSSTFPFHPSAYFTTFHFFCFSCSGCDYLTGRRIDTGGGTSAYALRCECTRAWGTLLS